ncbi:MAG TPA: DUF488 family protein [Vicinamibacterales bacterium]|nr:DUF488 family protein [Vicinamibacterales bacterium]
MIRVRRVYDPPAPDDGLRILVDRLWPRGLSRRRARIDEWRRDLAPSSALRVWFGHRPERWTAFRQRYRAELERAGKLDELRELARRGRRERITLLFGARDALHNNAVALALLLRELGGQPARLRRRARRTTVAGGGRRRPARQGASAAGRARSGEGRKRRR